MTTRTKPEHWLDLERQITNALRNAGGQLTGAELDALFSDQIPRLWFVVGGMWGERKVRLVSNVRDWAVTKVVLQ